MNTSTTSVPEYLLAIPVRLASTRLPNKPLLPVAGKPLLWHVLERAAESQATRVIVAGDDQRILEIAQKFGVEAYWTPSDLPSGTDRIAYIAREQDWPPDLCVVNLQGDEPLTPGSLLDQLATALHQHPRADMATLATRIHQVEDWYDPNQVKVVADEQGRALYFSRAPIPWEREALRHAQAPCLDLAYRHLGLYAYRAGFLRHIAAQPPVALEVAEQLEQLRALAHGAWIQMVLLDRPIPPGVDTPEDLERLERIIGATQLA